MIYRFDSYEFEGVRLELRSNGDVIKVEPQVSALLELLLTNHGRIVSKEEINKHVWGDRIVSDGSIDNRISAARSAIGDDGKSQRLIKTFPGRGFRFVGDVEVEGQETDPGSGQPTIGTESSPNRRFLWPGLAALLVLIMGAGYFLTNGFGNSAENASAIAVPAHKASIAVLPFADMSEGGTQKYLGDGLAEELLNVLVRVDGLKVSSRTSAFLFGEQKAKISEIGTALGVDHVLEGSVRQAGNTIRVTAQLIEVRTDSHIWSKTYDRPLDAENILEVQDEIAAAIVSELLGKLNLEGLSAAPRIASAKAYEHYLRAKALMREATPESLKLSIENFEKAISEDPEYVAAYAGLTLAYEHSGFYAGMPDVDVIKGMEENVAQALKLAPDSAEALTAAGTLAEFKTESKKALDLYQRAIAISPKYSDAIKGEADIYAFLGQYAKSLKSYELARVYDPLAPAILANIADLRYRNGDIEGALEVAQTNLKWNSDSAAALNILSVLEHQRGNYAQAHQLLHKGAQSNAEEYNVQKDLSGLFVDIGMDAAAQNAARRPSTQAIVESLLGNRSKALQLVADEDFVETNDMDAALVHYLEQDYATAYPAFKNTAKEYDLAGKSDIGLDELLWAAEYAFVLGKNSDPDGEIILNKIEKKISKISPSKANIQSVFLGGSAVRMMRGDQKGALEWIDRAIGKGHAFLKLTQRPIFAPLSKNPGYASRLKRMQANAKKHREVIEKQMASRPD